MKAKLVSESLSMDEKMEIVDFLEETELGIYELLRKESVHKDIRHAAMRYVRDQMDELVDMFIKKIK